ncbi:MAG: tRNA (adenosine(37)-N6)-threonylcarbamoyltransferase complex transferase subunit TsaD [Ruminococcaceae bacterium]|nr:tRNA (adenosine(37)-N6)-threonylcarbamoyltransferase complex transferase subunit TsaD [Oscillospiraceae bacterium]
MSELILAIESSCDETAAAVVQDGRKVLSNIISSQIPIHQRYGGVVPEIASRNHVLQLPGVIDRALAEANCTFLDLAAIAVTYGPGLVGALLTGVSAAKALAAARHLPLIGVNHIHGHIAANYIAHEQLAPPFVCLVASGGHSHIVYVKNYTEFEILGRTRDDAAGEAFDKIARVLGLGYPGGPKLEKLAQEGNPDAISFPRVNFGTTSYDFSFSGVKTAVINYVHKEEQAGRDICKADLAASFQQAVVEALVSHTFAAAEEKGCKVVTLAGGVSANGALRQAFSLAADVSNITVYYPPLILCTDNAAMIGCAGYYMYKQGNFADNRLNAVPNLKL